MNRHSTTKVSTYPSITITSPTLKSKKQIFLSTFISKHLPRLMISKTQKQMKVERFNSCSTHTLIRRGHQYQWVSAFESPLDRGGTFGVRLSVGGGVGGNSKMAADRAGHKGKIGDIFMCVFVSVRRILILGLRRSCRYCYSCEVCFDLILIIICRG